MSGGQRACNVCVFDPFWNDEDEDFTANEAAAPNLVALRNQIRFELMESQRKFTEEMEKKLAEAFSADRTLAITSARKEKSGGKQDAQGYSSARFTSQQMVGGNDGTYKYLGMKQVDREPSELQLEWQEAWLKEVEDGELDVYTCLGLSNCFSWTPDTRQIFMKAVAVIFLQMAVPMCLLVAEIKVGIELGPAENDLGFRLVGFVLYGYAIYSMYNGADGHCRTKLLNLFFQYDHVPAGHWLPLIVGEISNVFTAVVLVIALYSIFTTQTEAPDLILNAVAVNFLCDCDGSFVDSAMREEAVETFKTFTSTLFTTQQANREDPSTETWPARLVRYALYVVSVAGFAGCACFMLHESHEGGQRDTASGFAHHVTDFGNNISAAAASAGL